MDTQFRASEHANAPIVSLHSSASSSGQWKQLASDIESRFAVHAFDLPGYGRDPLKSDLSQNGAAVCANPVIQKIEELGNAVHLVGHSYGGGVAIKVALMRPDLVKSLTIYEPAAFHFLKTGDAVSQRLFQQIQFVSGMITAEAASDSAALGMKRFLNFWNGDGFWKSLPTPAKQRFAGMITSVMADFANGFAETWKLQDLSELHMPSLVMTGLESPEVTQRVAIAVANALPNSRIALCLNLGTWHLFSNPSG